jgi:hypothetical protein
LEQQHPPGPVLEHYPDGISLEVEMQVVRYLRCWHRPKPRRLTVVA